MGRPRKKIRLQPLSVRVSPTVIAEVDACVLRLRSQVPLLEVSRTDAIRYLLQLGLEEQQLIALHAQLRRDRLELVAQPVCGLQVGIHLIGQPPHVALFFHAQLVFQLP